MTIRDLQLTLSCMGLEYVALHNMIGKTVQPKGLVDDDVVKTSPMVGMWQGDVLVA